MRRPIATLTRPQLSDGESWQGSEDESSLQSSPPADDEKTELDGIHTPYASQALAPPAVCDSPGPYAGKTLAKTQISEGIQI